MDSGVASYDALAQQQAAGGRPSAPFHKLRRGRETAEKRRPDQPMVTADWPELPPIQGESRHAGKPPRGAGIIAFRDGQSAGAMSLDHYVCIVQKADGKPSFPKGGRKAAESVIDAALREWQEECGIPGERLQLVRGFHVDEPMIGVRYLLVHCIPNANSSGPDPPTPGESAWRPPAEDLSDNDPIVKARWVSVERCLRGELSGVRRELLRQAFAAYKHSRLGRSMGSDVKQLAREEDAMPRPVLFWREFEEHGYLSNWGRSPFDLQGHHFNCAEQYLMWSKADVMGDVTSAQQILSTPDPKRQKALGRQVHPWDEGLWKQRREAVMLAATRAKFAQNSHLRQRLLETHPRRLAEASPFDKVWGIGLAPDNPLAQYPQNWKGENLLGQVLEQVRGELLEEKQSQL
jgi:hypothetical protein